jgi:2-polyprenyl-3-methyl-5-hydroxy-6-metoxy-1,4-benzoquinol methylase
MKTRNDEVISDWSNAAEQVTAGFGENGDFSREYLLNPTLFSLLGDVSGKTILDAGCGQGYLARMLAKKNAIVTGIEPAEKLLNYAITREHTEKLGITYVCDDLSIWKAPASQFDFVVSNMVLMDIPDYQNAIKTCISALKSGGVFIFSILHPCFEESVDWEMKQSICTKEYFEEYEVKQFIGVFFHRTLSTYLNFLINNDCTLDQMIEPQLPKEIVEQFHRHERNLHVPSFLVVKFHKNT